MKTYFDPHRFLQRAKWHGDMPTHPWEHTEGDAADRYYDFKAQPELIPQVLEDWAPWAHYPSVQRFYDLLTWMNGPNSPFESNDCRFYPPRPNAQHDVWPKKTECVGLLMFYSAISLNLSDQGSDGTKETPLFHISLSALKCGGSLQPPNNTSGRPSHSWVGVA